MLIRWTTTGRLFQCTRTSCNNWLVCLYIDGWGRGLNRLNTRILTILNTQWIPTITCDVFYEGCRVVMMSLKLEEEKAVKSTQHKARPTLSSWMTENIKLWPSASPRGLSLLGHICNKGNEQATFEGLLLLLLLLDETTLPGRCMWIEPFDSHIDELSPPESLVALDPDCFGLRHNFFRRDDEESRLFSSF